MSQSVLEQFHVPYVCHTESVSIGEMYTITHTLYMYVTQSLSVLEKCTQFHVLTQSLSVLEKRTYSMYVTSVCQYWRNDTHTPNLPTMSELTSMVMLSLDKT